MNCVSVRPFFLAAATVLATFRLFATVGLVQADDIRWTGNQSPGAYPVAQGSFHDGANWQYFAPPGVLDRAVLGSGLVTEVNPTTSPRYVYFGDSTFIYPNTPNQMFIPGGTATVEALAVQSGAWTFDFNTFGDLSIFNLSEIRYGNLHVNGWLTVGGPAQDVSFQGAATTLNVRGPGETHAGAIAAGWDADYAGTINVSNGARLVSTADDIVVGFWGDGALNVSGVPSADGIPTVETPYSLRFGVLGNSLGTLFADGGATFRAGQRLDIGVGGQGQVWLSGPGTDLSTQEEIGVGYWGHGMLDIRSGATAHTSSWMSIAIASGSAGEVVVEGNGSQLNVADILNVGFGGEGHLTVRNGASVVAHEMISVGDLAGANGELVIADGGTVQTHFLRLGEHSQAEGRVNLSGNSLLDVTGTGLIGHHGHGEVRLAATAALNLMSLDAAIAPTATAEILVTGESSHLTVGGDARLGDQGAAQLHVVDNGYVSIATHLMINATSEVNVSQGGMVTIGQAIPISDAVVMGEGGLLSGAGTIVGNIVNDGGVVSPGFSPGKLDVVGNYLQGSFGSLDLEIGGLLPGQYDQLSVTGNLSLAGTVNIAFIDGFLPSVGDQFDFFQVGGTFDLSEATLQWNNAPAGFQYSTAFQDGLYSVHITAVPEPSTLVLAACGALGILGFARRRSCKPNS
ncbi:MAG: PEP-CTERM sorting domain-containing protein [Pirellulales bacterium]|nr:PEP-CTERM sorting domain-containing protein [Pirellulales bacterium]